MELANTLCREGDEAGLAEQLLVDPAPRGKLPENLQGMEPHLVRDLADVLSTGFRGYRGADIKFARGNYGPPSPPP